MEPAWAGAFTVLLLTACATAAWLPAPVCAQDEISAREHFGNGVQRFESEDYEGALAAFRDAYRLQPHPTVLVNIANCYFYLDRPVEASSFFRRYLVETEGTVTGRERREIEEAHARAEAAQSELILVAAPGIEIFIDGGRIGTSPLQAPVSLNPGPHIIEFSDPSGEVYRQRIHTERGESLRVEQRAPLASAPVEASANSETAVPAPGAPSDGGGSRALAWVSGGIAVSTLVVGAIFGLTAMNQRDEFEETVIRLQQVSPSDPNAAILRANGRAISGSRQTNAAIADVLFAASLISAGISIYGFLRDDSSEPNTTRVDIVASDSAAVISLRGGF
jgi:hypothetical protein